MKIKLLALPAAGALLAFGAAACSSGNTAQLDSWAKSVCDSAQDPIARSNTALQDTGQVKQGESPADLRKRLSTDMSVRGQAVQQIAAAVDKAGAPKIDGGADLHQQAVRELGQASTGYQQLQKKVDALPTDDQAKFADGLKSVGDQAQQLAQLSGSAIARLQTGDLGRAIAKQPGCKSIGGGAPSSPAPAGQAPAGQPSAGQSPVGQSPAARTPAGRPSASRPAASHPSGSPSPSKG
ncbi:small secreted protein [Peterkaempfera sp. SMS 1(5)a]|uniref:small secreted protein n=1 Tax=Peterkaempfera podocarpi TaxID=3232308 RepID=UPI00366FC243